VLRVQLCLWLLVAVPMVPPAFPQSDPAASAGIVQRDGQHDFDFEFGSWKAHIRRLRNPLTGSSDWVEYEGTSVVQKVWDGKANLGELEVEGPAGRIEGLSLRTYNSETGQWRIHWASSSDGTVGPPMVGGFEDGRGEFYNQEFLNGRAIYVRFIFSDLVPDSFRIEQAFSADGGKTWETNWIATFEKVSDDPDAL
jgi:hypothetical protein